MTASEADVMMTPDSDTISDHKQRHHWKHAHDHDRPAVARRDTAAASEAAVEAAASAAAATAADNTNQGCGTSNKGSSECSSTRTKSQPINTKKQTKFHSASTLRTIHASTTTSRPTTIPSNRPGDKILREIEERDFYKNYDAVEGAMTAIVLGGFFAFVCLLVMYKTKCKPMWKNRRKRLTTTPATASVAEPEDDGGGLGLGPVSDACQFDDEDDDEDFGFECVPLQSVCNEEDTNDDIYFLDEFGNYVFPVSTPNTIQGSCCSCPPSAEELTPAIRRVSQVSSISAAYTVKSLPGAYLYIPVLDSNQQIHSVPSLPTVKRALSDPQIHFVSPHPVILTVNPSSEASEVRKRQIANKRNRLSQLQTRSFSINTETGPVVAAAKQQQQPHVTSAVISSQPRKAKAPKLVDLSIDINVIQPTPNISPSASLKSFEVPNGDLAVEISSEAAAVKADIDLENKSGSSPRSMRRVSFSEDEVTSICSGEAEVAATAAAASSRRNSSQRGSLATSMRQMTVPMAASATMSYLQVPGQQLVAPHLTSEAVVAQTSPQARRRRSTRLMKTGSFCSITSEDDGDIFGEASSQQQQQPRASTTSSPKFDPLSEYSELHNDDAQSDISDLFAKPLAASEQPPNNALNAQGTLSETGSIEDITYEVPTHAAGLEAVTFPTEAVLASEDVSSCSLSIGSDDNNHLQIITVPVTIEHPPPEMRQPQPPQRPPTVEAGCQQATPASIAHHMSRHSDQGHKADLEDKDMEVMAVAGLEAASSLEPGMRMVLVRDIGIQVSGDSPDLNSTRKLKPSHHHHHHHKPAAAASEAAAAASANVASKQQDSLAEKFPAEILF